VGVHPTGRAEPRLRGPRTGAALAASVIGVASVYT